MNLKIISCGKLETNSYVLYDNDSAVVIDAPDGIYRVVSFLKENNLKLKAVLLTHGHFDHTSGAKELKDLGAKIYMHEKDLFKIKEQESMALMLNIKTEEFEVDEIIKEEGKIKIDNFEFEVFETPGHTEGGVVYLIEDKLFSGDTMFRDSFGRVDFFDSDAQKMKSSLEKLYTFNEEYIVYPGHGDSTTIKREKVNNLVRYVY